MKHAVARKKTVSPLSRKGFSAPKKSVVKATEKVNLKSSKSNLVKSVSVKSKPVVAAKNARSKTNISENKITAKAIKTTVSAKEKISAAAKPKAAAPKETLKPNAKKIVLKAVGKTVVNPARKTKPTVAAKQEPTAKIAAPKAKSKIVRPIGKPNARKTMSKVAVVKTSKKAAPAKIEIAKKSTAKSKVKAAKTPAANGKIQKAKIGKIKIVEPIKTDREARKKITAISGKKIAAPKVKAIAESKKTVQKSPKLKLTATKKIAQKPVEAKAQKAVKTSRQTPKQAKKTVAEKKIQTKTLAAETPTTAKVSEPSVKKVKKKTAVKIRNGRLVLPPLKKIKTIAVPIKPAVETVDALVPKPRQRKAKPFGAAIFRGIKERYDFQVFPVDGEFEDAAAIFIISRRVVDHHKRAHHKMVCIGQTASVVKELKKHRKGICFRQHQANAISVLREENEQKRLKIEADLKSAHRIPCPHS